MGIFCKLNSACCGCTVAGVTVFFLYFGLITSAMLLLRNVQAYEWTPEERQQLFDSLKELFKGSKNPEQDAAKARDAVISYARSFRISVVTNGVISAVLSALALYGHYNRRPAFFVPYLIYDGVGLLFMALVGGILLICSLFVPVLFIIFFIYLAIFGVCYYVFLIIYNHYRNLLEEVGRRPGSIKYSI